MVSEVRRLMGWKTTVELGHEGLRSSFFRKGEELRGGVADVVAREATSNVEMMQIVDHYLKCGGTRSSATGRCICCGFTCEACLEGFLLSLFSDSRRKTSSARNRLPFRAGYGFHQGRIHHLCPFRYFSQELGYKRNRSDLTDALGSEAESNFINNKVERRSNANILKSKKSKNDIEREMPMGTKDSKILSDSQKKIFFARSITNCIR